MGNFGKMIEELWGRTSMVQRIILVGVILACLGSAVLLFQWATKPQMALLYSGLVPEEAAKVVEKVRESGTPYELQASGTSVYVPAEKVASLRLTLAGAGLPGSDQSGYKILDDPKLGVSPFIEKINYMRAVEGELVKSITLIDGVTAARVHVVQPSRQVFTTQQQPTTASVILKLRPGMALSPGNVGAIVHMLSGAVEGLAPEKVVVMDSHGKLLSGDTVDGIAKGLGSVLDAKTRVEMYLGEKAEKMLEAVLGKGKASVRVDVVLDTSTVNEMKKAPALAKGVLVMEESKSKTTSSGTNQKEGAAAPAGGKSSSSTDETTRNEYAVGETLVQTNNVPGTIKSRTVAAMIDLSAKDAQGKAMLTQEDAEKIIRNAIGLSATDSLTVVNAPMQAPEAMPAEPEPTFLDKYPLTDILQKVSLGVLVVGVLIALRMFSGPKKKHAAAPATITTQESATLLPATASETADMETMRQRIADALQDNPTEVKRLFLNWVDASGKGGA